MEHGEPALRPQAFWGTNHLTEDDDDYGSPFGGIYPMRGDPRMRRLEMPIFSGTNVDEWLFKAERKAFKWYCWYCKMQPVHTWAQLKGAMIVRYRESDCQDVHERFFSLVQTKSVLEYQEQFEELASAIESISEKALMSNFMTGLKADIHASVRIQQPMNLYQTMTLAQLVEEKEDGKYNRGTVFHSRSAKPSNTFNQRNGALERRPFHGDQQQRGSPFRQPEHQ
ncbi:hypothetical protein QQ045_009598 [Rhodiola kirilowii]